MPIATLLIFFGARVNISFQHMWFWYPFLDPHPTIHHSNIGVRLRSHIKSNTFTLFMNTLWSGWVVSNFSKGHSLCPLHNHIFHVPWLGRPSHVTSPLCIMVRGLGGHVSFILDVKLASSCLRYVQWVDIFLIGKARCSPLGARPPPVLPKV